MAETVLRVEHVGMRFNLSKERVDSLKDYILKSITRQMKFDEFWALKDINFTLEKGERIGILGTNGAGKSTLLKVIAGVFKPTEGSVVHKGKIVPLLELGAGFDKEYTGRENIYLYGAVLGYSKEFIDSKFDEIVKFSGLKKFLDVPLKNYSSGMKSRLGFSIATIVEPEILILDEVLSVGDAKFRKKSEKKILSMTDEEHPCQILADLLTIEEIYGPGSWKDMKIAFVGDGDNNMSRSWMWAAKRLGFTLAIGAPTNYLPLEDFRRHLDCENVIFTTDPVETVKGASVINTDVWLSMGQESEGLSKEKHFYPYQVNRELLEHAASGHSVFHCLPAYRGKEITEDVLEHFAPVIFREAENRVHAQKAVLATLADARRG